MTAAALPGDALDISAGAQGGQGIGGQAAGLAPGCCHGTHIASECTAEKFLGGYQVTGLLIDRELFVIDKGGLQI